MSSLSHVFKAYDIRGLVPEELNALQFRAIGVAVARFTGAPTILVATYAYSRWSTKWSLMTMIAISILGLATVLLRGLGTIPILTNPVLPLALLIIGSTGVISMILPYTAENYPVRVRGRATGWIAGCSKIGGLIAQGLSSLALVPAIGIAAAFIAVPAILAFLLIARFGHETKGRDLQELEAVPKRA